MKAREVSNDDFAEALKEIVAKASASELLNIPGIYEILSEHYNNLVLTHLGVED